MVRIRFLTCHTETDECDNGGACIGEIVKGVSSDGDGIAKGSCKEFAAKQAKV